MARKSWYSLFIGICLILVLVLSLLSTTVSASPALVDPRLNRLESQVRSLQSQVTRLQSQLSRVTNNRTVSNTSSPVVDEPSFDQQFDTLEDIWKLG
ncbi:MAG: hypothetical protein AAGE59_38185 [Cyanobacteria bacterium P01_F01_bin.86]